MKTKISTIFIGAGTAAMAAANRLLSFDYNDFLIIEKGNFLIKRVCPGAKKFTCKFCKNGCPVTEGIGGANALHGNKICYFPASDHVWKNDTQTEKDAIVTFLDRFSPFLDSSNIHEQRLEKALKFYNSDVLNKNEFEDLIAALSEKLIHSNHLITNTTINEVTKNEKGKFLLKTAQNIVYECDRVVFAAGRSSFSFAENLFDQLGIYYTPLHQDLGIRIETNKEHFSENYYFQVDPKIKFDLPGIGLARTFCAHNQGFVTPVQFGKAFFADGAFGDHYTTKNNIALMVRSDELLTTQQLEKWCESINHKANHQLKVANIKLDDNSPDSITNQLFSSIEYPSKKHADLMRYMLRQLFESEEYKILKNELPAGAVLTVYGPAIDRYWVSPSVDQDYQSADLENFYIIGDAVGKSRGIYQAMYTGVSWANQFHRKINQSSTNDKIWSSGIPASIQSKSLSQKQDEYF